MVLFRSKRAIRWPRRWPCPRAFGAGIAGILLTMFASRVEARIGRPCEGRYADALDPLPAAVRDIERGARGGYTYLVRSRAVFECPYYALDGKLQRRRLEASRHGTALAYEQSKAGTYLLTNEHVLDWPAVSGSGADKVDGVPTGCKRVEADLRIVANENDEDEARQTVLRKVASDVALDAAILKAAVALTVIPYRPGRSADLRQGNAVQVRGFPLGLLQAVNAGKVVNVYDRDQEDDWDHVDFVIDALLSEGSSGSPVLALSCRTGTFELVGMYHAGYRGHGALNVVVGIDELQSFMDSKRAVPRRRDEAGDALLGADERETLLKSLSGRELALVDMGGTVAALDVFGETGFRIHMFGPGFPSDTRRRMVIESGGPDGEVFWFLGGAGWRRHDTSQLDEDDRALIERAAHAIGVRALETFAYRGGLLAADSSEQKRRTSTLKRTMDRREPLLRELVRLIGDLGARLGHGQPPSTTRGPEPWNPAKAQTPKGAPDPQTPNRPIANTRERAPN